MKQSLNKKIGKKYYNTITGQFNGSKFFVLPTIIYSPKHIHQFKSEVSSLFIGWGKKYIQINFFKDIQNDNVKISKEVVSNILQAMNLMGYELDLNTYHVKDLINHLENNTHLILLTKNANPKNEYYQAVLKHAFNGNDFFVKK